MGLKLTLVTPDNETYMHWERFGLLGRNTELDPALCFWNLRVGHALQLRLENCVD